jgi:cystathionine beta-lyase/cystathionine gamma-synthase
LTSTMLTRRKLKTL